LSILVLKSAQFCWPFWKIWSASGRSKEESD
jgi:hypothetical protein